MFTFETKNANRPIETYISAQKLEISFYIRGVDVVRGTNCICGISCGKASRYVLVEATARDVRNGTNGHILYEVENRFYVNSRRCEKRFADRFAAEFFFCYVEVGVIAVDIEHLAAEREAVGVYTPGILYHRH